MAEHINPHPFDPLTPEEISMAAKIVGARFTGQNLNFRFITLKEAAKQEMIVFLELEHNGQPIDRVPARRAHVQVVVPGDKGSNQLIEFVVDLGQGEIVETEHLAGKHSYIDSAYMKDVERACLADERVQAEIRTLDLPCNASVCVEPWAYATDGMNDMSERITMCYFYMRLVDNPDANYYAYPLDICAEVSEQLQVIRIYRLPISAGEQIHNDPRPFDRSKIHSAATSEYHPSLRPPLRTSTKPYQVVQPEGPSFEWHGNLLSWEKWRLRVGFNYREGLTLHDVRYDGRSLFYRLSLAEMFVPYGDPRCPYQRKAAFDLGNDGAGVNANDLRLGCDCLGAIRYLDGWHNTRSGEPLRLPNAICCHEQDDGILWKHTNFRTGNAVVTRSRVLVLQTIITVSNYEYIFAFHFGQDASIHYEVRATGILSTVPIRPGEHVPYGTVVAPGVLSPYHQHLFSLRIDPALDGHANSLQVEETVPMPFDESNPDLNAANPFGIGFTTRTTTISHECGLDLDIASNRTFKLVNESRPNILTGTPVGYKLIPHPTQLLLAHPRSHHARRSEYAAHAIWVTRYRDGDLFPAGRHTMQSAGGAGIASGIEDRLRRGGEEEEEERQTQTAAVRDADIVVWHTFGSTHNPRAEDWPVMPCEKMLVGLKPVNFFDANPGIDVAVAAQETSGSVLVGGGDGDGNGKGDVRGCFREGMTL